MKMLTQLRNSSLQTGYNHNIRYRGRDYHVQTEDSGREKGHIHTHVFLGGTVISTAKIEYDPQGLGDPLDARVVRLMQESHQSMTRALLQLSRLSRALRPRALLLDARCPGTAEVVSDLADTSGMELLPILVFTREPDAQPEGVLTGATDAALVEFVESQPERKPLR